MLRVLGANDRPLAGTVLAATVNILSQGQFSNGKRLKRIAPVFPGMARKGQVLQRALEAAPSPEGFGPVLLASKPEIHLRARKAKACRTFFRSKAGHAKPKPAPKGRAIDLRAPNIPQDNQKLAPSLAFLAKGITQAYTLIQERPGWGKRIKSQRTKWPPSPPGFLIQDIVQAFPVTGTETAAACRLKIDIWKNMLQSGAGFLQLFPCFFL